MRIKNQSSRVYTIGNVVLAPGDVKEISDDHKNDIKGLDDLKETNEKEVDNLAKEVAERQESVKKK